MGMDAWVSQSCVLGANSLKAQMVVLELLKAADHSGTMLGLLIHWPRSRWLSGAALPGATGGHPTELGPSVTVLVGRLAGAGAKY